MLPPLQISATRLPASRSRRLSAAGQRRGSRRLHEVARRLDHGHDRGADLVVGDEHEVVEVLAHDALRQLEGDPRREPLGERLHAILDQPALLPRAVGRRRRVRLHADHLDARRARPWPRYTRPPRRCRRRSGRRSRRSPARPRAARASRCRRRRSGAARRPSGCSDSRARRASCAQRSRASSKSRPCTTISAPSASHRRHLHRVGALGHADDRAHAEEARRIGDRLAVVAGRCRDDAAGALLGRAAGRRGSRRRAP